MKMVTANGAVFHFNRTLVFAGPLHAEMVIVSTRSRTLAMHHQPSSWSGRPSKARDHHNFFRWKAPRSPLRSTVGEPGAGFSPQVDVFGGPHVSFIRNCRRTKWKMFEPHRSSFSLGSKVPPPRGQHTHNGLIVNANVPLGQISPLGVVVTCNPSDCNHVTTSVPGSPAARRHADKRPAHFHVEKSPHSTGRQSDTS